jgi:hypothetical protein
MKNLMFVEMKEMKFGEIEDKATNSKYFEFEGYLSTFGNKDLGDDICVQGCFADSLKERTPKLLFQHDWNQPVGIFTECREDQKGLFVKGKMPLEDTTVSGKIAPQMKIGSINSMSIGYRTKVAEYDHETGIRKLIKVDLWEGSIVTLPMNPEARIEFVKSLQAEYAKLQGGIQIPEFDIAEISLKWEAEKAQEAIKTLALDNIPELPVFDVVEGKAVVSPRGMFALKAQMIGAKGGFKGDKELAKAFLNEYYEKMNLEAPFKEGREVTFCETEMKNISLSEMSYIFRNGKLSKSCSDYYARKALSTENADDSTEGLKMIRELNERLTKEINCSH